MSANIPSKNPKSEQQQQDEEKKNKFDDLYSYAKTNPRDVISYVLLVLGIVLLFAQPIYGGLLVGIVAGVYFSQEIIRGVKNLESIIEEQGLVRSIIAGAVLLAFFILAPAIFVGAAVMIGIKVLLGSEAK